MVQKEKLKEIFVVGSSKFFGSSIKKKGIFNLKKVYDKIKGFLKHYKYALNEKGYTEKILPQGKEINIELEAERKVSEYVKFIIFVNVFLQKAKPVERGKIKANLLIRFKGYFKKDYKNKWKHFEFLRQLYDKYVIENKLKVYEGKIWAETNDLIDLVKEELGLIKR